MNMKLFTNVKKHQHNHLR